MQRLFTKFLREQYKPFLSHTHKTQYPNQLLSHYHPPIYRPNRGFTHFTTPSNWGKFSGFFSNPRIVDQLVKFKGGFFRAQLFQRGFSASSSSLKGGIRGWRLWLQSQSPDNVVIGLIISNVAVFMLWRVADRQFMKENFMISLENFKSGRVHTIITSAFSHIDVGHLLSNMIGLYFFGTSIGRNFGSDFLLKLYLAGAIGGSVFYLMHKGYLALSSKNNGGWSMNPSRIPGLGASGAVNAIMLLDIFLFPKATLYVEFIIPVPAILLGVFIIGKDMLRILQGDSQVSGAAHLGGAVVAALAWARIRKGRF